jgi:hypothetical protein
MTTGTFDFRFATPYRVAGLPLGITSATTGVHLEYGDLTVRFGPWTLRTPLSNVESATQTGPYGYLKTIGPPHLSFADKGITFATNADAGVCIRFKEPVTAIEPFRQIRHPGATVTVADPEGLQAALLAS